MNPYGRHLVLTLAIACLGLAVFAAGALAAPFGDGGRVLTAFGTRAVTSGTVEDLALAGDGRVAVAVEGGSGLPIQVAVLNPDGSLDDAFSGDGLIQPQLEAGRPFRAAPVRVAFAGEDLLVAGGIKEPEGEAIGIREYGPDGGLVRGFGKEGLATAGFAEPAALFVQPGGDVALFGSGRFVAPEGVSAGGLARFSPTGKALGATSYPHAGKFGHVAIEADGGFLAEAGNGEEPFEGTVLRLDPAGKVLASTSLNESESFVTRLIGVDAEGAGLAYLDPNLVRLGPDLRTPDPSFDGSSVPCAAGAQYPGFEEALPSVGGTTLLAGDCGIARVHADGSPDASFGSGGLVPTRLRRAPVAVAADGSVVYATTSEGATGPEVVRLAPNGAPDAAFGSGGRIALSLNAPLSAAAKAVVTLPGGKGLVAAGGVSCGESCRGFAVARYDSHGHLVRGFGAGGKAVVTDRELGEARAVALAPGGRIVVAGTTAEESGRQRFALLEIGPNGAPVRGFGEDGIVLSQLAPAGTDGRSEAAAVAVQANGRIVVAGLTGGCGGGARVCFTVARYLPSGALDKSFAHGGVLRLDGRHGPATALALSPGGKVVATGGEDGHFVTVRLTSRGRLDHTFGRGGIVDTPVPNRFREGGRELIDLGLGADALAVSRKGVVTVTGSTGTAHTVIERYAADGKVTRGFGRAGRVTIAGFGVAALRPSACGLLAAGTFKRAGREAQMGVLGIAASGRRHSAPRALFGPLRPNSGAALALLGGRAVVAGEVDPFERAREFALAGAPLGSLGRCS